VTALPLPKSVHIEGNIEPAGVDMSSQNPRLCRRFAETRLPDLAIRVGEVPGSNPGAPIFFDVSLDLERSSRRPIRDKSVASSHREANEGESARNQRRPRSAIAWLRRL
jgi:hypothetical protein